MSSLACPKCVGPLQFGPEPRGAIGTCYDCWGLWIDTQQLHAIHKDYPVGSSLYKATTELRPENAKETDLLCPACADGHLVRQNLRGVELEWCSICRGIYLDKGERERLLGLATKKPARGTIAGPPVGLGDGTSNMWGLMAVGEVLEVLASILTDV